MKYYSESLGKLFDTEKELTEAETTYQKEQEEKQKALEKKNADRAEAAKKVEQALADLRDARKNYNEVLSEFCKKYGAFHYSFTGKDAESDPFGDLFSFFFD